MTDPHAEFQAAARASLDQIIPEVDEARRGEIARAIADIAAQPAPAEHDLLGQWIDVFETRANQDRAAAPGLLMAAGAMRRYLASGSPESPV